MFLNRIHLDPRCKEARRDLADPYQLHSTLCRAFSTSSRKCPPGEFLWRLEPETDEDGLPRILVQSRSLPDWTRINVEKWLAKVDQWVDLRERLRLDQLKVGQRYRFRLRANPSVFKDGKRLGLLRNDEQEGWLERRGVREGFTVPKIAAFDPFEPAGERLDVRITQEQMLRGKQHDGNAIHVYSVLYDGVLTVTDPDKFRQALEAGVGHGKVMGLGLLSVVPLGESVPQ